MLVNIFLMAVPETSGSVAAFICGRWTYFVRSDKRASLSSLSSVILFQSASTVLVQGTGSECGLRAEMHVVGPPPGLRSRKPWRWNPGTCLESSRPCSPTQCANLRTPVLGCLGARRRQRQCQE